ncbi:hypothetical protein MYP_4681 [Sporocytophaga myxococcoides]|uniref:Uncharacterized protein n=1 Tax=Sporocytophaga myxococcoides TaxID=153721 RepID=A0A098LM79_9BACT|nr:hypothetical protein MYP_4681 [Sporocytophaga myxococcoides]
MLVSKVISFGLKLNKKRKTGKNNNHDIFFIALEFKLGLSPISSFSSLKFKDTVLDDKIKSG